MFKFCDEPVQARATRIAQSEWSKHKHDIIREYCAKGLPRAMEWMARTRSFHATAKQYQYQLFTKWGITKTNKQSPRQAQHPSIPQSLSEDRPAAPFVLQSHGSPSVGAFSQISPAPLSDTASSVQPHLSQRASADEACFLASNEFLSPEPGGPPTNKRLHATLTVDVAPPPAKRPKHLDLDSSSSSFLDSLMDDSFSGTQPSLISDWSCLVQDDLSPFPETSLLDASISTGPLEVDVGRPVEMYTQRNIEAIKLAADFLLTTSCFEDAFPLYILVWKRIKDDESTPGWMKRSIVIACVLSAVTTCDLLIVRNLLDQWQSALGKGDGFASSLDTCLGYILLCEICLRRNNHKSAAYYYHAACNLFAGAKELFSKAFAANARMDHLTYLYLFRGLTYNPAQVKTKDVYIRSACRSGDHCPSDSQHSPDGEACLSNDTGLQSWLSNAYVRECLLWIIHQLKEARALDYVQEDIRRYLVQGRIANLGDAYYFLWSRWNRRSLAAGLPDIQSQSNVSQFSDTLLVGGILSVMAAHTSQRARQSHGGLSVVQDAIETDFLARIIETAEDLLTRPEDWLLTEISYSFLRRYYGPQEVTGYSFGSHPFEDLCKERSTGTPRPFVENELYIRLPESRIVTPNGWQPAARQPIPEAPSLSNNPTLAPSLHSTDSSSFKKLASRIKRSKRPTVDDRDSIQSAPIGLGTWMSARNRSTRSIDELSETMSAMNMSSTIPAYVSDEPHYCVRVGIPDRIEEEEEEGDGGYRGS